MKIISPKLPKIQFKPFCILVETEMEARNLRAIAERSVHLPHTSNVLWNLIGFELRAQKL